MVRFPFTGNIRTTDWARGNRADARCSGAQSGMNGKTIYVVGLVALVAFVALELSGGTGGNPDGTPLAGPDQVGDTEVQLPDGVTESAVFVIANAIAFAEGFQGMAGNPLTANLPYRNNNPGDLLDSAGRNIPFPNAQAGWAALYNQVIKMLSGTSRVYSPGDSIAVVAQKWTGGDNPAAWAAAFVQYAQQSSGLAGLTEANSLADINATSVSQGLS